MVAHRRAEDRASARSVKGKTTWQIIIARECRFGSRHAFK
jgi:hypothetical protein